MAFILIIGATSDIGKAIAHEYARHGSNIYLAARYVERVKPDAYDLAIRYRVKVKPCEIDVLDFESHAKFYASLPETPFGVVCVAGYLGENEKAKTDFTEARKIIDTNYTGCVSILNICARSFEARKMGFIVGISSVAGDRGRQSNYYYGSAKAAFTAYLSGLRGRLHTSNVQVLTVKPGFVYTQMTEHLKLPGIVTVQPDYVAGRVYRAQQKKKNTIYVMWLWRWIMMLIKCLPENVFIKMKL